MACDSACVDTVMMRRYYLPFFIAISTQRVFYTGITAHPTGEWTTQATRNLILRQRESLGPCKALMADRGSQFTAGFDEVFRSEQIKIHKTPVRTPIANASAEQWIGSLRRELLDRTLEWNRRQLERIVLHYSDHYNQHPPHRTLAQHPTKHAALPATPPPPRKVTVLQSSRCNGLIHQHRNAPDQPRPKSGHPDRSFTAAYVSEVSGRYR